MQSHPIGGIRIISVFFVISGATVLQDNERIGSGLRRYLQLHRFLLRADLVRSVRGVHIPRDHLLRHHDDVGYPYDGSL